MRDSAIAIQVMIAWMTIGDHFSVGALPFLSRHMTMGRITTKHIMIKINNN